MFAGTSTTRQSVGLPGHCERCASIGHVQAHPQLGCSDVGCSSPHPEPSAPNRERRSGADRLDNDTRQYGLEGPFTDWEDDHTSLVHVLWSAQHDGVLPAGSDCDELASRIMHSRWMQATRSRAAGTEPDQARRDR